MSILEMTIWENDRWEVRVYVCAHGCVLMHICECVLGWRYGSGIKAESQIMLLTKKNPNEHIIRDPAIAFGGLEEAGAFDCLNKPYRFDSTPEDQQSFSIKGQIVNILHETNYIICRIQCKMKMRVNNRDSTKCGALLSVKC